MASSQEIMAGRAFVRLFLKNDMASQLSRGLKSAGAQLKGFGRGAMVAGAKVTAIGAALLAPLAAAVRSFAAEGDMLDKMSLRTGIAASSLAELGFAAEQSGTSLDAVAATVLKMNRRFGRVTAGAGTANQISALEELGLSVDQLRGMDAEGRFMAIGDAVAQYGDNAAAAGLAQRVFGTGIDAVLPLLLQGRDGIAALRDEARDLGIVPTEKEVANAAKVTDAINRIKRALKAMKFNIGAALAEPALQFLNVMKNLAVSVGKFAKNNRGILLTVAAIGAVLVVAGTLVTAFGVAVWAAGMALTALGSVVGFLLSPIGLIVAAVVGGAVAWVRYSESGKRAWASLKAAAMPIIETLKTAFSGIKDALKSGDWSLAGKIAMAALKLAFFQGLSSIQAAFPKTFNTVFLAFGKIGDGIIAAWAKVMGFLTNQWNSWGKSTVDTVMGVASQIVGVWQKTVEGMANWMLETSAKGGVMGKAMSKVLGVDMAEEQARSERLDRKSRELGLGLEPTDILADARKAVKQYTEQLEADLKTGLGNAGKAADEFMQNLPVSVTANLEESIEKFLAQLESGVTVEDAAKELAALRKEAATQGATQAQEKAVSDIEDGGVGGLAVASAPGGAALTATYSAAAARIAGFQAGGGPEKKMVDGITEVAKNTKASAESLDQFLNGWKIQ